LAKNGEALVLFCVLDLCLVDGRLPLTIERKLSMPKEPPAPSSRSWLFVCGTTTTATLTLLTLSILTYQIVVHKTNMSSNNDEGTTTTTAAAPDLVALQAKVTDLGAKVKELKTTGGGSPEDIQAAVASLLQAKKEYAEANNGIGVDGKPFVEGSAGGKKKKDKVETGPAKPVRLRLKHPCFLLWFLCYLLSPVVFPRVFSFSSSSHPMISDRHTRPHTLLSLI
jgi:hypothetical protein